MRKFIVNIFIVCWICYVQQVIPVHAKDVIVEQPDESSGTDIVSPAKQESDSESLVDKSQKYISSNLISISRRVDAVFSSSRMMEESIGSYACLSLNAYLQERVEHDYYIDYCVKIDLPGTEKRWKLVLTSNQENDEDVKQLPGVPPTSPLSDEETTGLAGVRYIAKDSLLRHINFDVGVKTSWPPNPYVRARYRKIWLPEPWLFRITEQLYWFEDDGAGLLSRLDGERKIGEKWYGRSTSEADYKERIEEWRFSQTLGVYKRVSKRQALNLEWQIVATAADNTKVNYYVYRLRYRINYWRDWLFFEASPQVLYDRESDFKSSLGLFLSVEAAFGNF